MSSSVRWLAALLLVVVALRADDALRDARRAQALLGPEIWSRVLRIDNDSWASPYPRVVHALVFEFSGVLWFYTAAEGTQSLSLYRHETAADKASLGPLLLEIDRGFRRWRELATEPPRGRIAHGVLRNGCFIESIVALRARLALGRDAAQPQLLAYYAEGRLPLRGHTVLAFVSASRVGVLDPAGNGTERWFDGAALRDPLALARQLGGQQVTRARLFRLEVPPEWRRDPATNSGESATADAANLTVTFR